MSEQSGRSTPRGSPFGRRDGRPVVGRLQEHGEAPYEFRRGQTASYYVKLLTMRGVKVLWGKDLERAISEGATKPRIGDLVAARRFGREPVTVRTSERDKQGNVKQVELHTYRARWEVEKLVFFNERAKRARVVLDAHLDDRAAMQRRPELRSTFISLRAAQLLAEERISSPEERERFLGRLRQAMAGSIRRGDPLLDAPLREKNAEPSKPSKPSQAAKLKVDDPTR